MTQGLFDQWGTLSRATAPFEIKNSGGERIPAWSPVEIESAYRREERLVLKVRRPTKLGWRCGVLVNGGADLDPDGFGVGFFGPALEVTFDPQDGTPKEGETWGPVKDSFKVRKHVPGGRVLEDGRNGRCVVLRYDPVDIWGKLTETLEPGGIGTATLYRYDPTSAEGSERIAEVEGVEFELVEATAGGESLVEETVIFARWDEIAYEYLLRGWVC